MIALVTGASRGLGYHIARGLGAAGLRVAITARESSALHEAADEIGALAVAADVTDPWAIERVVAQIEEELGPIAVLVNNAGIILREHEAWNVAARRIGGTSSRSMSLGPTSAAGQWSLG